MTKEELEVENKELREELTSESLRYESMIEQMEASSEELRRVIEGMESDIRTILFEGVVDIDGVKQPNPEWIKVQQTWKRKLKS